MEAKIEDKSCEEMTEEEKEVYHQQQLKRQKEMQAEIAGLRGKIATA